MAIELKFSKSDSATPWGFRLVGGSDFDQPVVVVKVNENSLAEDAGLEVGDIIVRVNNTPTAGLTHTETHDLLQSAGLEFELGIRRDAIRTKIICDEDYNFDVSEINETVETSIIDEAVKTVENISKTEPELEETNAYIKENLEGQEEILKTSTTVQKTSEIKQGKKWSTFLIKPDKPVPKSKQKIEEEDEIKDEPYRVLIKKQQRRPSQGRKVQFDSHVTEVEVEFDTEEIEEELINVDMTDEREIESVDVEVEATEIEESTVEETKLNEESETEELEEELHGKGKGSLELKHPSLADIKVDSTLESSIPLEEQLLAVQKQLQALSQLPSAIQITLDAVSRQLANIVGAKENAAKNGDEEESNSNEVDGEEPITEEEILEDSSVSEGAEAEINRDDTNDNNSSIGEELEDDGIKVEILHGAKEEEESTVDFEEDPYYGLTEEEKEEKLKEEQMLDKQKKVMDERPLRPVQRPIILPGGRRWANEEDAIPKFRKPKMSEEKIIETIENNLEVIIGKRKGLTIGIRYGPGRIKIKQSTGIVEKFGCKRIGMIHYKTKENINFLKYQPPPKNLDYLQRSEVYRLVHDMEPPVRGITSRAEKVLAVQDYYEANKGAP